MAQYSQRLRFRLLGISRELGYLADEAQQRQVYRTVEKSLRHGMTGWAPYMWFPFVMGAVFPFAVRRFASAISISKVMPQWIFEIVFGVMAGVLLGYGWLRLGRRRLRAYALLALVELGDPRAATHFERLRSDGTECWQEDNHGPMVRVCDVANEGLARLRAKADGQATSADKTAGPRAGAVLDSSPAATFSARSPVVASIQPAAASPPVLFARSAPNFAAYVPLAAAVVELPWIGLVVIAALCTTGTVARDPASIHVSDAIAMIPVLVGLLTGILVIARGRARRLAERVCVWLGCAGCGLFLFSLGWEFFH